MSLRISVAVLTLSTLAACAQPADPSSMVAPRALDAPAQATASRFAVGSVAGGEETIPLWTSEVSAEAFRTALTGSLANAGLLAPDSALRVEALLQELDQPLVGISMTVTATVIYRVIGPSDEVLFAQSVSTPYTAEFSEAFLGVERLRVANQGAIRTNIARFVEILLQTPFLVGDGLAVS